MSMILSFQRLVWLLILVCMVLSGTALAAINAGSSAPDFTAKDLNGKTVKLSQFEGQPVLLYFWATW